MHKSSIPNTVSGDPTEVRASRQEPFEWRAAGSIDGLLFTKQSAALNWTNSDKDASLQETKMVATNHSAQVEFADGGFLIDAALLSELLDVVPADVPSLMRANAITSICERGIDVHEGEFRLNFFYRSRRARLSIDTLGHVLSRSVTDVGRRQLP